MAVNTNKQSGHVVISLLLAIFIIASAGLSYITLKKDDLVDLKYEVKGKQLKMLGTFVENYVTKNYHALSNDPNEYGVITMDQLESENSSFSDFRTKIDKDYITYDIRWKKEGFFPTHSIRVLIATQSPDFSPGELDRVVFYAGGMAGKFIDSTTVKGMGGSWSYTSADFPNISGNNIFLLSSYVNRRVEYNQVCVKGGAGSVNIDDIVVEQIDAVSGGGGGGGGDMSGNTGGGGQNSVLNYSNFSGIVVNGTAILKAGGGGGPGMTGWPAPTPGSPGQTSGVVGFQETSQGSGGPAASGGVPIPSNAIELCGDFYGEGGMGGSFPAVGAVSGKDGGLYAIYQQWRTQ